MVRTELRYFGRFALTLAVILSVMAVDISVSLALHLGAVGASLLFLALCGAAIFASVVWWLRCLKRRMRSGAAIANNEASTAPSSPVPAARYAPVVITIAVAGFQLWLLVSWFFTSSAAHTALPNYFYLTLCVLILTALSEINGIFRRRSGNAMSAFTAKRLDQMRLAHQLPTRGEQRSALRPLVLRGYARLALLVAAVVAELVLAPHLGIVLACALGIGGAALIFVVLRGVWDI